MYSNQSCEQSVQRTRKSTFIFSFFAPLFPPTKQHTITLFYTHNKLPKLDNRILVHALDSHSRRLLTLSSAFFATRPALAPYVHPQAAP